jgi:hypothetical protein
MNEIRNYSKIIASHPALFPQARKGYKREMVLKLELFKRLRSQARAWEGAETNPNQAPYLKDASASAVKFLGRGSGGQPFF